MPFRFPTRAEVAEFLHYELSYNITRQYPFKRRRLFKYIVLVLFVLAFVWYTIFNIATLGYSLEPLYTIDPNGTINQKGNWYNSVIFTWGGDDLDPKCQGTNLAVGSQFMTTNMAFHYTLTGVYFNPGDASPSQQRPSISYLNNNITNCHVTQVDITLSKKDNSQPGNSWWWSWGGGTASATGLCDVSIAEGSFSITFTATYLSIPENFTYLVIDNDTTHASAWWGARLLDDYMIGLERLMTEENLPTYTNANLQYTLNITSEAKSIKDSDFFSIESYYFLGSDGGITNNANSKFASNISEAYNNVSIPESRPMTEGFSVARILYSFVLLDLGNSEAPNLLLDDDTLQYILDPPDNFNRRQGGPLNDVSTFDWWRWGAIAPPGTPVGSAENSIAMDQAFSKFEGQTGPLGTRGASIYSQYICSVPKAKGRPTIVLLALVADIALLQATWAVFKFFAGRWLEMKHEKYPKAMHCEGCASQEYHEFSVLRLDPDSQPTIHRARSVSSSHMDSTRGLLDAHHVNEAEIV